MTWRRRTRRSAAGRGPRARRAVGDVHSGPWTQALSSAPTRAPGSPWPLTQPSTTSCRSGRSPPRPLSRPRSRRSCPTSSGSPSTRPRRSSMRPASSSQVAEERETLEPSNPAPSWSRIRARARSCPRVTRCESSCPVRPASIPVPVLRGLAEEDAIAVLLDSAFVPGERTERHHGSIAPGSRHPQRPGAGTIVALDTAVDYVVSLGVEPTTEPGAHAVAHRAAGPVRPRAGGRAGIRRRERACCSTSSTRRPTTPRRTRSSTRIRSRARAAAR